MLKIAQVVCVYPPYAGGIGNCAWHISQELKNEQLITNFTLALPGQSAATLEPETIYLRPGLRLGHGGLPLSLYQRLKKFDLIYLHYPFFGGAEIVWLFKIFHPQIPLIIHYHMDVKNLNWKAKILSLPSRLIRANLFNRAAKIIAASADYVSHSSLANYYQKQPTKFAFIPFGVDSNLFQPLIQINPQINHNPEPTPQKALKILFVGGLDRAHYFKGVDILLTALSQLLNFNWVLTLAGDGDLKPDYQQLASKLNIANRIKFRGQLRADELAALYAQSDLFVLPSINSNEAFGLVLLEAMSSGLAVIASALPGVRTVFSDQQEGLFVQPGSVRDLKDKLEFIITHEDRRLTMGLAGRNLVNAKYSWTKTVGQINDLIKVIAIK